MPIAVLCVDDEPEVPAAYRIFLGPKFSVTAANGGEAALTALTEEGPFAVIVADLHMPGMDGIRLLAAASERYPDTVRVLATGCADLNHAMQAVNDGHVFRILTKPISPAALTAAVSAAADQHQLILSDRRRTADELRASEERFRTFIDQAADAVFVNDLAGRFLDVNRQACESLGYTRDELLARSIPDIDVDYPPEALDAITPTITAGEVCTLYGRQRRKDGTLFPVEVRPRMIEAGGRRVVMSIVRDITERKRAEEKIRASEVRYRRLFDASPHPMWVTDAAHTTFLEMNSAAVRRYGYSRAEFLALPVSAIELPHPRPDPGGSGAAPRQHRLADGQVRQMEVSISPTEFDGRPARLSLMVDVTDRKHLEEQLKQAQKLESIGQLAAGIAHEINTPVQYIGDNTAFIRDAVGDLSRVLTAYRRAAGDPARVAAAEAQAQAADLDYLLAEAPKALDQTRDGVQHVARIVKAMKEFAHPGSAEKSSVDLNRALETVITVARNEWKYVAEVRTDLDPGLPAIRGLPGELNQVFLNLLVNAAHAIQASGRKGVITLSTRAVRNAVEVRIADTGCGIPEAARGRVFDPFFTTKPVGQGTGQGLAIAHAVVVKQHGGTITFESEVGRGTTFVVRLPVDGSPLTPSERIPAAAAVRVPTPCEVVSP